MASAKRKKARQKLRYARVVSLLQAGCRVAALAHELDCTEEVIRRWIGLADLRNDHKRPVQNTRGRMEAEQLRLVNERLRKRLDILLETAVLHLSESCESRLSRVAAKSGGGPGSQKDDLHVWLSGLA